MLWLVVAYEDMTPQERDRFVYLILGEAGIKAVTLIMRRRHGPGVSVEQVMRFAFKVAMKRALGRAPAAAASGSAAAAGAAPAPTGPASGALPGGGSRGSSAP
jgi:hypothetical protein